MSIKYIKKILLLLTAAILMLSGRAAVPFQNDSTHTEVKKLNQSEINTYKKNKAFIYRDEAPQESGFMAMFWYYVTRFLRKLFSAHVGPVSVSNVLIYGLMIFGVLMLIFQFLRVSPQSILSRSSASIAVDIEDGENIHEINFDKLIQQSAAQQNYRLAVRFWYLKMLKIMSDGEMIQWQINKTNYDYYYELKQQTIRNEFLTLTNTFENAWYGNHELSTERYDEAQSSFQSFFTIINKK